VIKIRQKNKISITRSVFLLALISLSGLILLGCNLINPEQYDGETISLKSSDNEITIITPENITYTEPMSGYYPATYGFENDEDGSDPEGWILSENPPNYEIEVVSEKQGHKKVVHLYDNENAWHSMNHYPDGDPTTGTIELWVLGVDVTDYRFDIGLWDTAVRRGFVVIIADDKWQYFDNGYHDVSNVGIPQDNTWHHLRIDFRCAGAPTYEGLSMASFKIIVDGIESGEMPFHDPDANHLERLSSGTDAVPNSEWWVDAVGFSWDPNYNIGDNLNEGLLLSFDKHTTLNWIGYSLDGLANKTIMGNTTIPMLADGSYSILVFGNDSLGTIYASNLRHFTIDTIPPEISIISPTTGQEFSSPPSFTLSITEENVASTWYTLNGGPTIPFTGESGAIDSTAWNALANGNVTIRFYVRDMANREDFDEVEVIKESQEIPTEIPGYNLILLIGVSCIIIVFITKKKFKFKN